MSRLWKTVVKLLDEVGKASGCHRMPERSFFFRGHQFPVCARCTGVAIGQFSAIIINFIKPVSPHLAISLLGIMGIDWGVQEFGIKESNNTKRFVTGLLGGFGLFSIYTYALKTFVTVFKKSK